MRTYLIKYKGRSARARGEDAEDAVRRYGNRLVFGSGTIFTEVHVKTLDADTRGKVWGEFWAPGVDGERIQISAELLKRGSLYAKLALQKDELK